MASAIRKLARTEEIFMDKSLGKFFFQSLCPFVSPWFKIPGMKRLFDVLILAALSVLIVSCQKSEPNPQSADKHGAAANQPKAKTDSPIEIITKSGIEMLSLPDGAFKMGSSQGNPDKAPPHKIQDTRFL